ncbi:hypothetical protein CK203_042420 [Vitis vinifera]|uniref:Uncharacterized protein n=1 Tax=Vitis vinifera TaxID=29760 RepID=A0A438H5A1_VITVI|nr:hypothetical protein CK203_042420 [Vitis vinifera]
MDSQIVTVDQFAEAMASIQEAIASLGRRIDGQQAQQVPPPVGAQYDLQCHHLLHPVSQRHRPCRSLCIVRPGCPPPITVPPRPQRTHMLAWIDLSRV